MIDCYVSCLLIAVFYVKKFSLNNIIRIQCSIKTKNIQDRCKLDLWMQLESWKRNCMWRWLTHMATLLYCEVYVEVINTHGNITILWSACGGITRSSDCFSISIIETVLQSNNNCEIYVQKWRAVAASVGTTSIPKISSYQIYIYIYINYSCTLYVWTKMYRLGGELNSVVC